MATIEPLRGIRYAASGNSRDISARIAPPYDVLDLKDKQTLLSRDPKNFVAIDLPHVPPKTAGPDIVYQDAARQMNSWLADGTLVRDPQPGIYAYYQRYRHAGVEYLRKKFFARLRLEEFGTGSVFPHEQTFGGPKEDRLCLTKATKANLSPIFGVYEDPTNAVAATIERALPAQPTAVGTLDGVEGRLWGITDPAVVASVKALMSDKAVFIADGHHRYGTSLLYQKFAAQGQGVLSADHPANYVLCVFCAMEDPGALILPTHRVLVGTPVPPDTLRADAKLEVKSLGATTPDEAVASLAGHGPQAVALFDAADGSYVSVRPRDPQILRDIEPNHSPAWRGLGLSFLHAYLFDRVITPNLTAGNAPEIHYVKAAAPAVEEARQTGGSVFLLQPTTMAELRGVCKAGDLMPQKSTYFFPKLASGMLISPLE